MKKLLLLLTALFIVVSGFAGCSAHEESNIDKPEENEMSEGYAQYVTLGEYLKPKVNWESETNASLLSNQLSASSSNTKKITDREVKTGDTVNIDYKGLKDGVAFEGGTAEGYDLEIGSGSFIDGFEDGLIGKMPGGTYNLDLTFPESYHSADLAGKAVVFEVKINYIAEKDFSDEATKKAKKEVLGKAIINDLIDNSTFKSLPQDRVNYFVDYLNNYYLSIVKQQGFETVDAYLEQNAIDKTQFENDTNNSANLQVKSELVINAIAEKEGISVSDDEYKTSLESYAKTYSTTASEFEAEQGKDMIKSTILQEKVVKFLNETAKEK